MSYHYDADKKGWDLIPPRPWNEPEKDSLVVLEVASGRRYGLWCTSTVAASYRTSFREGWESRFPHVDGVIEMADVTLRSDAVVAVHVPPGIGLKEDQ